MKLRSKGKHYRLGAALTLGEAVDEKTGKKLIRIALDSGINFFDSADVYALGKAEQFYGKALSGIKRQDLSGFEMLLAYV